MGFFAHRSRRQSLEGECSANANGHTVYINSGVPSILHDAIVDTAQDVYTPITDFSMVIVTQVTGSTDAIVFYGNYDPTRPISYTYCPNSATTMYDNVRYQMYCLPQFVVYQNNTDDATECWSDDECAAHYACHEIGHTTGLQHPSSINNPDTCMGYANSDPPDLRPHDAGHLTNCYPRPTGSFATFPAETRTASCKSP
jgi:hypothetical protein